MRLFLMRRNCFLLIVFSLEGSANYSLERFDETYHLNLSRTQFILLLPPLSLLTSLSCLLHYGNSIGEPYSLCLLSLLDDLLFKSLHSLSSLSLLLFSLPSLLQLLRTLVGKRRKSNTREQTRRNTFSHSRPSRVVHSSANLWEWHSPFSSRSLVRSPCSLLLPWRRNKLKYFFCFSKPTNAVPRD